MTERLKRVLIAGALVIAALTAGACGDDDGTAASGDSTDIPQATSAQLRAAGLDDLPLAPRAQRLDLEAPPFSDPTRITNPLFPIANLPSAILAGKVDRKDFKTETTLLPGTRIITWKGGEIETLVSQYVAYLDGRIEEVAIDHYAQADDGSVWYLGEDVYNYEDGFIADTEGTWLAGREGPPAMIMPAKPKVGDTYRPENIPGLVFEEVTIKAVGKTVAGPHGPVAGAVVASELHQDGTREDKTFAPGYGEFFTGGGGDVEAMALAVPVDELPGPPPEGLKTLSAGADDVFAAARSEDWRTATAATREMTAAWEDLQRSEVPRRLGPRMSRALDRLVRAVGAREPRRARIAAIDVAQSSLDLQLRHRAPAQVDRGRFELWARRLVVDAQAEDLGGARSDLATLEWIRDRFAHTLDEVDLTLVDAHLVELRGLVTDRDLEGAAAEAQQLRASLSQATPA